MPNENSPDAATHNVCMDDNQHPSDNLASTSHHMKNSPSDEEFYGAERTTGKCNTFDVFLSS